MKTCGICKEAKPLTAFYVDRDKADGRTSRCKECARAYLKKYYVEHKDTIKTRSAKWHVANFNKKAVLVSAYHKKHRDKVRQYRTKWQKANSAYRNESLVRRRRAKGLATPLWANRDAIRQLYKHARRLTLETCVQHHVDHIVPLRSPIVCGLHVEHNLQVIPWLENVLKHNRLWPDMPGATNA